MGPIRHLIERLRRGLGIVGDTLAPHARSLRGRVAVAVLCVTAQLAIASFSGRRFDAPFNSAPGQAPAFRDPSRDNAPERWNRLVVSRWDAGHYIGLGLRGYSSCPPRGAEGRTPASATCDLAFYPTFGWLGRLFSWGGLFPIDYALLGISLLSSVAFLILWTSEPIVSRLGLGTTYLALLLFNVFTTGYTLATPLTEPLTLALTMGAFVAFSRHRYLLAALLAGAASGLRLTAVAVSAAFAVGLIVEAWNQRPLAARAWIARVGLGVLGAWGVLALMTYHTYRFGDPLAYVHAHASVFKHHLTIVDLFLPNPAWLVKSLEHPMHEGVWLAAGLFWFLLGHREALRGFARSEQAFWYTLFVGAVGIAAAGQLPISFLGMNRYLLLALPLFFAMAAVMRTRALVLVLWVGLSVWHYWNVDLCQFTGGPGSNTLKVCHDGHWVGHI